MLDQQGESGPESISKRLWEVEHERLNQEGILSKKWLIQMHDAFSRAAN